MLLTERNLARLHAVAARKQNVGIIVGVTPASLNGFGLFTQECFETPLIATSTLSPPPIIVISQTTAVFGKVRRSSEAMDLEYLRSSEIGQERKKYKIERQTSKLFAACASMLGSKLPVFS